VPVSNSADFNDANLRNIFKKYLNPAPQFEIFNFRKPGQKNRLIKKARDGKGTTLLLRHAPLKCAYLVILRGRRRSSSRHLRKRCFHAGYPRAAAICGRFVF